MPSETDTEKQQDGGMEPPSVKELYFDRQGREFLVQSGNEAFYEETKTLPYFDEIRESWRITVRNFNVGTPKGLKVESIAEQLQLELLFIELRHSDFALTLQKYSSLIEKHSEERVF